jgi:glycosyltransferase involved in cell wall biosynthesis
MENKLVSVLMSVYNGEKYLFQAIQSILCQSYRNFEFIIINDGSTDGSEKIIQSFKDPRIVFVQNEKNKGLIYSLNLGLQLSKGDLIARMDADDISLPERLTEQVNFMNHSPQTIVLGSNQTEVMGEKVVSKGKGTYSSDYLKSVLLFNTCFSHPSVMIRNVFTSSNIRYDASFLHAEDFRLWTELAKLGQLDLLNKNLLRYRIHAAQISNKHGVEQDRISSKIRQDYMKSLGFVFTEQEAQIHDKIGNHVFVTQFELLVQVEKWLMNLIHQNSVLKALNENHFLQMIVKNWLDTCGNSNLGWKAYRYCLNSEILKTQKIGPVQSLRLLAKCIIRSRK